MNIKDKKKVQKFFLLYNYFFFVAFLKLFTFSYYIFFFPFLVKSSIQALIMNSKEYYYIQF